MKDHKPGLIVLGLDVIEMEGIESLEILRRDERLGATPIMLLANRELTDEEKRQLDGNILQMLKKKSYSRDELLSSVSKTLSTLSH